MSRTPVGLVNHPATNCNWQLSVANGCLNEQSVLPDFACGSGKGVRKWAGRAGCSGRFGKIFRNSRARSLSFGVWRGEKVIKRLNM